MGSCVSVHKDSESAMKLRLSFGSKNDNLVTPSPIKDKPIVNGDRSIAEVGLKDKSHCSPSRPLPNFHDFGGSKEEAFFDSRPCLDSDCEDDYFSVNGDFTPSCGTTPVHQSSAESFKVNENVFKGKVTGLKAEPAATDKKKKLSELFKESLPGDQDADEQNPSTKQQTLNRRIESKAQSLDLPLKSKNGAPYVSGVSSMYSSERTPNGDLNLEGKSTRSAQCCLPRLLSSRSFSERKKASPTHSIEWQT